MKHHTSAALVIVGYLICVHSVAVADAADRKPQKISVVVSRNGDVFKVESESRIVASRDAAWAVLTDYDGYVDFVPGMISSRLLSEQPLRIEQHGIFRILFLRRHVYSTLDVLEDPPSRIRFRSVGGNLRRLDTEIGIYQVGDESVLTYYSIIEPDFWVPSLFGTSMVRNAIREKLTAVAEAIERRAAKKPDQ